MEREANLETEELNLNKIRAWIGAQVEDIEATWKTVIEEFDAYEPMTTWEEGIVAEAQEADELLYDLQTYVILRRRNLRQLFNAYLNVEWEAPLETNLD